MNVKSSTLNHQLTITVAIATALIIAISLLQSCYVVAVRVYVVSGDGSSGRSNAQPLSKANPTGSNPSSQGNSSLPASRMFGRLSLEALVLSERRGSRVGRSSESPPLQQQQQKQTNVLQDSTSSSNSLSKSWIELNVDRVKPSWLNVSNQYKIDGQNAQRLSNMFGPENLVRPAFDTPIILKTNLGLLEGVRSTRFNKHLYTFLGVPYAEPPIDKLRFKAPVPIKRWSNVLQATKWPPFCVQPSMTLEARISPVHILTEMMNEDCLYLNVWTTSLKLNKNKRRPVMAFIHGGAFQFGGISVEENDGSSLALLGEVVVVTFNYRLGVFGFLNANNPSQAPNNAGLLDQQMALEWIQTNIRSFGGDPLQVTLFGESAGGHSVGLHLISPKSFPLFRRAILQSGVPLSFLRSYDMNSDVEGAPISESISSVMLTKRLKCYTGGDFASTDFTTTEKSSSDLEPATTVSDTESDDDDNASSSLDDPILDDATIECLRNYSSLDILKATGPPRSSGFLPTGNDKKGFLAGGTVKESFDPDDLKIGPQKEFLIGTNTDEGAFMLHFGLPTLFPADSEPRVKSFDELKEVLKKEMIRGGASWENSTIANNPDKSNGESSNPHAHLFKPLLRASNSLMEQFITRTENNTQYKRLSKESKFGKGISTLVTDILFLCPAKALAKILADANRNVYYYVYNHRSSQTPYAEWMGVTHHDEVEFVFGRPLRMADSYSGADIEMSQRMIKTWAHFAYTGKMPDQFGVKWPAYSQEDDFYMNMDDGKASVDTKLHERFCNIYENVIAVHLQGV